MFRLFISVPFLHVFTRVHLVFLLFAFGGTAGLRVTAAEAARPWLEGGSLRSKPTEMRSSAKFSELRSWTQKFSGSNRESSLATCAQADSWTYYQMHTIWFNYSKPFVLLNQLSGFAASIWHICHCVRRSHKNRHNSQVRSSKRKGKSEPISVRWNQIKIGFAWSHGQVAKLRHYWDPLLHHR